MSASELFNAAVSPIVYAVPVAFILVSLAGFVVWKAAEALTFQIGQQYGPMTRLLFALRRWVNRHRDANLGRGTVLWSTLCIVWRLAFLCLWLAVTGFLMAYTWNLLGLF